MSRSRAPSLRSLAADLLGEDPYKPQGDERRLPVHRVARRCPRGAVMPACRGKHREPVAVVRLEDGRAFVVPDRCPHNGSLLSDGFVEGERLVCARHGWEFDPATGRCAGRPDVELPSRPLRGKSSQS